MIIFIPSSPEVRDFLITENKSGNDITAKEAHEFIERYKRRVERLDELSKKEPSGSIGRTDKDKETLGWLFPAKELKEYVGKIEDESQLLVLFGVGTDNLTHVIITEEGAVDILRRLPDTGSSQPRDNQVVGKEHGSSCCSNKSVEDCFEDLFITQVSNSDQLV